MMCLALPVLWAMTAQPSPSLAATPTSSLASTTTKTSSLPERAADSRWPALEARYSQDEPEAGLREARALLPTNRNDVELQVLTARFLYEVGERHKRDDAFDKVGLYTEMVQILTHAQSLAPGDARVGWGLGIAKGRLATTQGVLASLSSAREIETLWLKAAASKARYTSLGGEENLPCDAYLTLGVFYRLLPDWWIVGVLAGTRGDIDKALTWLNKANTCAPQTIRVKKELGVGLLCAAERRHDPSLVPQAQALFREGLTLPAKHSTEFIDQRHMRALLTRTKDACGYSRDGQQNLNEGAIGDH